ncbi:MAG: sterol desaturase family protein [Maritimibacter harenae]
MFEAVIVPILIVVATVAAMEFVASWSHKYIMHGWGWGWHESHHVPHEGGLEKNDLYAVVGSVTAIFLFALSLWLWAGLFWIALGVTIYGALYFMAHDGLVHHRWPFKYVPKNGYLKRVYQAHRLHHAVKGRDGCVSFGFIWAPPIDRLKADLKKNRERMALEMYESEDAAAINQDGTVGRV